jgi:hypothetical protein
MNTTINKIFYCKSFVGGGQITLPTHSCVFLLNPLEAKSCALRSRFTRRPKGNLCPRHKAKCPLKSAGILFITGGPKEIVRITYSGQKQSFFDDVGDSNFGVTDLLELAG